MSGQPFTHCSFAHPGTYGHECGKPAVVVGITKSETGTIDGLYYHRRCRSCSTIKGGENAGITEWIPFDPAVHINRWR